MDVESLHHNQGSCWKQEKMRYYHLKFSLLHPSKEEGAELSGNDPGGKSIARRWDSKSPESLKEVLE